MNAANPLALLENVHPVAEYRNHSNGIGAKPESLGTYGPVVASMAREPILTPLADVQPERVAWLWASRIPRGKLTLLDGDPDLGKSTCTLDLAARVSRGVMMPDGSPGVDAADVILLSAEDGLADTVRPRLDAAGADCRRVTALTMNGPDGDDLPSIPGDLTALRNAITERRAALVVVDPLMAYLSGTVNSHRDQDVRRALAPLASVAESTGAALVVLRHNAKAANTNPLYRGGGSIGIIGAARSGLVVARDPDDESRCILAVAKGNLAPKPAALAYRIIGADNGAGRVEWLGATAHTAAQLLATAASDDDRSAVEQACDVLRELLGEGPLDAKQAQRQVEEASGVSHNTVRAARIRLGVIVRREGFGRGGRWLWALPAVTEPRTPSLAGMFPHDSDDDGAAY